MRRLRNPRPLKLSADSNGRPVAVLGQPVEQVCESWLIEDLWWSDAPIRRHYFEVITENGRNVTLFRDLRTDQWFSQ